MVTVLKDIRGMTCGGCASNVERALLALDGIESATVDHVAGTAEVEGDFCKMKMTAAVVEAGYQVGEPEPFNWGDKAVWRQSASNTKWCLIGCSIGEFGTLAAYSYYNVGDKIGFDHVYYYPMLILPLINGLITSVLLETGILMKSQMDFSNAFKTAMGMSFIGMLMMEIAMEITDLLFTGGKLGMNYYAIPLMLLVGFLTPWPYNYWRLKKYGKACH